MKTNAYAALGPKEKLAPYQIERRAVGENDVAIEILYCGVCHSDIHQARNEWGGSTFPIVPGHEIVGKVVEVGNEVKNFRKGDIAGVGCMVDSCRECESCKDHEEQFCIKGCTWTYNAPDKHTGKRTYGGYSTKIVVDEDFVLKISKDLDLSKVAPLLCAGITTYSPLRHWKAGKGKKVGINGLGGLGHMALKFADAFGAHVVQFTTSKSKIEDAKRLGADEVVLSNDKSQMDKHAGTFDLIIDTVSAPHDANVLLSMLKRNGSLVTVGVPIEAFNVQAFSLIGGRRSFAGSLIGGVKETQEMLDYCAKHGIVSDVEVIKMQDINAAYERMLKSDVKYRFVIDMSSLK
jgi:alcohol dehydrogenase (NADP+)